jgi:hypothetical protein
LDWLHRREVEGTAAARKGVPLVTQRQLRVEDLKVELRPLVVAEADQLNLGVKILEF